MRTLEISSESFGCGQKRFLVRPMDEDIRDF